MRSNLKNPLLWAKKYIYSGRLKKTLVNLGLDSVLQQIWEAIFVEIVDDIQHINIGETTARFRINSYSEYSRITSVIGERLVIQRLLEDLHSDDVVYDIGANIGIYTCFILSINEDITTVAFEPHTGNIQRLAKNARLNGRDWRVNQTALGEVDGIIPFHIASDRPGESRHSIGKGEGKINTTQRSIDTLVDEGSVHPPSVLKIDVEGAELAVLKGASDTLDGIRLIYCEVHKDHNSTEQVKQFLKNHDYQLEILQKGEETEHIRAYR